jgi:hypothetical protein
MLANEATTEPVLSGPDDRVDTPDNPTALRLRNAGERKVRFRLHFSPAGDEGGENEEG